MNSFIGVILGFAQIAASFFGSHHGSVPNPSSAVPASETDISFDLPAGWSIASTTYFASLNETDKQVANTKGEIVATIECPPTPTGYEGDYGAIASSSRSFVHDDAPYTASYELDVGYDNAWHLTASEPQWFFSKVRNEKRNEFATCLLVDGGAFSPEDIAGLISIYRSWR